MNLTDRIGDVVVAIAKTFKSRKQLANTSVPAGNTVTATAETAFATQFALAAGALAVGSVIRTDLFGTYTAGLLAQSFTLRLKIGGVNLLAQRATGGLLGSAKSPWSAQIVSIVTSTGIVSTGSLNFADSSFTLFGGDPVPGVNLGVANPIIASAQWGAAGNSVTLQGFSVNLLAPAA